MGAAIFACLTSREARECESNCLHSVADWIGPVRKCPHCAGKIHEPKRRSKSPERRL